ncbi:MAG TPA: CoA pyrophosphatase [Burkholderiaceae bacterium]|nr:CoA pyrophosphatase [Burkholderiaceae bacterium]
MTRPPLLDPQAVPVTGTDAHLPPVEPRRLAAAALRERFAAAHAFEPEIAGDAALVQRDPSAAAVLVPLVVHEAGVRVLLTRRTEHLRDHAGQISFPGGRVEPGDADAVATALREAEEEVGLEPQRVDVIGALPDYTTVTRFVVTPVVALVQPGYLLKLDPFEVAEAFEVPLDYLMTPAHHRRHQVDNAGVRRQFLSMPWEGPGLDGVHRNYFIWGATAAMLRNLYRFLAAT